MTAVDPDTGEKDKLEPLATLRRFVLIQIARRASLHIGENIQNLPIIMESRIPKEVFQ